MTDSLSEEVKKIQKYLVSYTSKIQNYRLQASNVFQVLESAYIAAIKDNNSLRRKFGLEEVSICDFLPPDFDDIGLISKTFGGINSLRKSSIASMNQYYDAESGEEDDNSDTSSYSSSQSDNILTDQASTIDDFENEISPTNTVMHSAEDLTISSIEQLEVNLSTPGPITKLDYRTINRRTKLPHPTISMESLNVMSILRNNVKFLSFLRNIGWKGFVKSIHANYLE